MNPDHVTDLGGRALALVVDPFAQFLMSNSLLWWPSLLSAFAVALVGFWLRRGGGIETLGAFFRRYFSKAIWAHPSAQADIGFYLVNSVFYGIVVAPLVVSGAAVADFVERSLALSFGPCHLALPLAAWQAIYTALFFLTYDFARYLAHSLLHGVPFLWHFHKVHHSAEVLTPLTSFRAHPVELFVMAALPSLLTGIASGVVFYLAAGSVGLYLFFGGVALMLLFNAFANLRHFQVWISFGPVLNRWLISPAHHQIHHSRDAEHFGRNRGFELAIWDRLFGTLYVPGPEEELVLGLGDGSDGAWHSIGRMYLWPCRLALAPFGLARLPAPLAGKAEAGS
jgi:sterol desaturase/sphingolipid hydroxylase (fatty acid hydroxylase superfamily)